MFALYDTVRAQVRLDEVRVVNGAAWVYSPGRSGDACGLGVWTTVLSWEREPEVARREGAAWRLEGPGPRTAASRAIAESIRYASAAARGGHWGIFRLNRRPAALTRSPCSREAPFSS